MNSKPSDQTSEGRTRDGGGAGSLGERLRLARQQRGISLREISDHTRISMRYLEAIEADDYKLLPGGIFNRSFVKAYARHVEFDEREALELYARTAREHGESPDDVPTSPQRSRIYTDGDTQRSPLWTAFLSAVILGILILGVYAGLHFYRRTENASTNAAGPAQPSAPAQNNAPAPTPTAAAPGTTGVAQGFQIQVKAKEEVWLDPRVDDQRLPNFTLKAGETREFTPQRLLSLRYSKSKLDALEVSVNGRPARAATETKGNFAETLVTRDENQQP